MSAQFSQESIITLRRGPTVQEVLAKDKNPAPDCLRYEAPATTLGLEDVSAELPGLVAFLSKTLGLSKAEVAAALADNFPRLNQSIVALPTVTSGWQNVPGTEGLTRFDGTPVRSVPHVRDYFAGDVIPVLERQQKNFTRLEATWPKVNVFPPLLSTIGVIVIVFGLLMALLWRPRGPLTRYVRSTGP